MTANSKSRGIIHYLHLNCARNFAIYRALFSLRNDRLFEMNVWRVLCNSSHDTAVIQWCSLFGSNAKKNDTHWSNVEESWIESKDDFITDVLQPLGICVKDWQDTHSQILEYRNKNIAHIQLTDWERDIPYFDDAISVLFKSFEIFHAGYENVHKLEDEYELTFNSMIQIARASIPHIKR